MNLFDNFRTELCTKVCPRVCQSVLTILTNPEAVPESCTSVAGSGFSCGFCADDNMVGRSPKLANHRICGKSNPINTMKICSFQSPNFCSIPWLAGCRARADPPALR